MWKYSWKRGEKKAFKDLERFWRVCDEFSWVYKPIWISSLPYTLMCGWLQFQGMKWCCVALDFDGELWFQFQKINWNCLGLGSTHKWNVEAGLDMVLCKCKFWFQFWKSVPIWSNPVCTNQNWNGHNSLLTKVGTYPTLVPKSHTLFSNVLWVKFYFV